jgi:hypothetical protein
MKLLTNTLVIAFVALLWAVPVKAAAPSVSYRALVEWYSPVIVQDLVCTVYGDYITRIDYDGNYIGNDNWDNLANFELQPRIVGHLIKKVPVPVSKARPLPAYVYYSVIESETHYFITYTLFHPADDFDCHTFEHENDLEGIVLTVHKDGSTYGKLRMVQLQAHHDFYQYLAPGQSGISPSRTPHGLNIETIDGTITLDKRYPGVHPVVFAEGGGHGLRYEDTGGAPSVKYFYTGNAEDPDEVGTNHVGYDLLSTFEEMWERRTDCCGAGHLFTAWGNFNGRRFSVTELGRKLDGNEGSDDAASAPWYWSDNDDDSMPSGSWFMDPADYQEWQFDWAEPFSQNYIYNPFVRQELCGDIFNGAYNSTEIMGTTTLRHGPYTVVCDVTIPAKQTLVIEPGVTVRFAPDTRIIADGYLIAHGSDDTIRLESAQNPAAALTINGTMIGGGGGEIRFSPTGSLQLANLAPVSDADTGNTSPIALQDGAASDGSSQQTEDEAQMPVGDSNLQLFLPAVQR